MFRTLQIQIIVHEHSIPRLANYDLPSQQSGIECSMAPQTIMCPQCGEDEAALPRSFEYWYVRDEITRPSISIFTEQVKSNTRESKTSSFRKTFSSSFPKKDPRRIILSFLTLLRYQLRTTVVSVLPDTLIYLKGFLITELDDDGKNFLGCRAHQRRIQQLYKSIPKIRHQDLLGLKQPSHSSVKCDPKHAWPHHPLPKLADYLPMGEGGSVLALFCKSALSIEGLLGVAQVQSEKQRRQSLSKPVFSKAVFFI